MSRGKDAGVTAGSSEACSLLSQVVSLVGGLTMPESVKSLSGDKLTLWLASGSQSAPFLRLRLVRLILILGGESTVSAI